MCAVSNFLRWLSLTFLLLPALPQTPPQKPPANPSSKTGATQTQTQPKPQENIPSPVSKHYPILIIAHGNEPSWSLRLGMKGPERLDRLNYPPIVLDPTDVARDESGTSWTYNAKDSDTGALVAVKLTRDPCSDGMSDTKYTFHAEVNHAQIGALKGCGLSVPDRFPEFRKKNQLDMDEDTDAKNKDKEKDQDKDKDKKLAALDPITKFASPLATAYLDSAGHVIVSIGQQRKTAALVGSELALSHDGKKLLYTRSDSKTGPERTIVLYEFDTGRSRDIAGPNVRQAFWSPDDLRIAYLKSDGKFWQVWTALASAPDAAAPLSSQSADALHGWLNPTTVLASDLQNAYWLSEDKPAQTVPLKDIYGADFQIMSSDTIRICPINPDLLLVTAYYQNVPANAPKDAVGLSQSFFLYELRSHRRTVLGPPDAYARNAEWSRDALQIFFTRGVPGKPPLVTDRIFWDSTGDKRYSVGTNLVIGR